MGGAQPGSQANWQPNWQPNYQPSFQPGFQPGFQSGSPQGNHQRQGRQAGVSQVIEEIASGGNGLNSLSRLLNFDDTEFWKGALVGAAAVMLLSNESVQNLLFSGGKSGGNKADNQAEGGL